MLYLIYGYLVLFIIRPFENWKFLAAMRIERMYGIFMLVAFLLSPHKRSIRSPQTTAVFAFFGAIGASLILAYRFEPAWTAFYKYGTLVVYFVVILGTIRTEKQLRDFAIVYLAIMGLYQLLSLREFYFFGRGSWDGGIWRLIGYDRTLAGPNSVAASIAYSMPFALGMLRSKPEWRGRLATFAYTALSLWCIVLTGSRSGLLTYLLACLLYFGSLPGKQKFLSAFLAVGMLILAWGFVPLEKQSRIRTITGEHMNPGEEASARARLEGKGFKIGLRMFSQRPVLGVGMGCFAPYAEERLGESRKDSHNLYGELLGQLGIVGTVVFLVMVSITFKNALFVTKEVRRGNVPRASPVAWISWAIIVMLILLLFEGWASHNLDRYNWLWAAAMAVLARDFVLQRRKAEQPGKVEERGEAGQELLPA